MNAIGLIERHRQSLCATLWIDMEHTLHHLPLLLAALSGFALLENSHEVFPLSLTGSGSHLPHSLVPFHIFRRLANHHQAGSQNVDLHIEQSAVANALQDLGPYLPFGMTAPVLSYQLGIITEIHCLNPATHPRLLFISFFHRLFLNISAAKLQILAEKTKYFGIEVRILRTKIALFIKSGKQMIKKPRR